jgi:hypothetical protein
MGFFDDLFGTGRKSNPANAALPYIQNIPGMTLPMFAPYINAGQGALPILQNQYKGLLGDPSQRLNQIGAGYKESPGLNFAIQKALGSLDRQSIAQGMGGSPQNREMDIATATGYANQDYNDYMRNALGLYGQGLAGEQGLATGGLGANTNFANMIANALAQSGNLAYSGQQNQNSARNSLLGGIGTGLGALSAFLPWSGLGNLYGGGFGSSMFGGG